LTLRARLTLWYTAVLAGMLILYGSAVYTLLSITIVSQVDDQLDQAAEVVRRAFQQDVQGIVLPPMALSLASNVFVQVWDTEGDLIAQNLTMMDGPFDAQALKNPTKTYSTVVIDGAPLRVLTYPLYTVTDARLIGSLQLASSMDTVARALQALLFVLVVGGVLAVGGAALVGWSTAFTALRPLERITDTALRITRADDLSRRIPLEGPANDEVGRLIMAFNETLERLEVLFETQRRFMADVSHELLTPLTAIRGNVDLIARTGEADAETVRAVSSEVDRLTRMVQDLMLLAQAETGKLPLAQDEVELDTLVLEVFQQGKILAPEGVDMRLGVEDQARVLGDRDRVKQVLLNLVANGLDHTPAGGSVTLGLECMGEWARITVSDTGSGIPPEDLPHIFERFYRVDRARARTVLGGAGLGLSIAFWITRSHGGRIDVASEPGKGSTFAVWLPLLSGPC
jgi:two-component system OmpR family sensor kinase